VERDRLLDGTAARAGDAILGIAATGLHANGFSLVRTLIAQWDLDLQRPYQEQLSRTLGDAGRTAAIAVEPELELATLGDVLLTPTAIYTPAILRLRKALEAAGTDLRGVAHITGGGLPGNVPRALPAGLGALLDPTRWPMPSIMRLFADLGGLADAELRATFNGGLGMIVVVAPSAVDTALGALDADGFTAWLVGEVRPLSTLGGERYRDGPLE
jgi:phosphoribosylformylglycinamidine cyclo-ligase